MKEKTSLIDRNNAIKQIIDHCYIPFTTMKGEFLGDWDSFVNWYDITHKARTHGLTTQDEERYKHNMSVWDVIEIIDDTVYCPKKSKQGEWSELYIMEEPLLFRRHFQCSECGEWQTYGRTDYCPNCGAGMRGEDDE